MLRSHECGWLILAQYAGHRFAVSASCVLYDNAVFLSGFFFIFCVLCVDVHLLFAVLAEPNVLTAFGAKLTFDFNSSVLAMVSALPTASFCMRVCMPIST